MQSTTEDEEDAQALRDAFAMMDRGGTGSISTKDFGMLMRGIGENVTEAELQDLVQEIDLKGDGSISMEAFMAMMKPRLKQGDPQEEMKEVFAVFDREKTGFIDANDVRQMMLCMGETLTLEEAQNMIAEADADDDGKVTFDDFVKLMSK